jgi:hypothetical protein
MNVIILQDVKPDIKIIVMLIMKQAKMRVSVIIGTTMPPIVIQSVSVRASQELSPYHLILMAEVVRRQRTPRVHMDNHVV